MLIAKHSQKSFFLHLLLFFFIASSVLTYWQSAEYALNGHWFSEFYRKEEYISIVPSWQKLLKDVLAFVLLVFSLFFRSTNTLERHQKEPFLKISYSLLIFVISISLTRSIFTEFSASAIFISIRPLIITISIFLFCHRHLNNIYLIKVLEATNVLALVQVYYSFLQREAAVLFNGVSWLSSGGVRSVGTFTGPNSMGLFLALCIYFNIYILKWNKFRIGLFILYSITIFLSDSRTSILIVFLIFIEKAFDYLNRFFKSKKDFVFINFIHFVALPLIATFSLNAVKDLSSRGANSSVYGGRLEIFLDYAQQADILSILFGKHLGFGSNILQVLQDSQLSERSAYFLADSTWAYLFSQFGILGMLLSLSILYYLFKSPYTYLNTRNNFNANKNGGKKNGLIIYMLCCFSTIIVFEFYAVLPILISLAFFIKYQLCEQMLLANRVSQGLT